MESYNAVLMNQGNNPNEQMLALKWSKLKDYDVSFYASLFLNSGVYTWFGVS